MVREETLLRKLVADGEGIGDDRRVQSVAAFFREGRSTEEPKVAEAVKVLKALEMLDLSMLKQKQVAQMNNVQSQEFIQIAEQIDKEIEITHQKMEEAKNELAEAKIVKKNRQEYRALVTAMENLPTRADTIRKLGEIKDDLVRQHERQKLLEAKLNDRRNHLQAFNIILANFQRFILEDDEGTSDVQSEAPVDAFDDAASVDEERK